MKISFGFLLFITCTVGKSFSQGNFYSAIDSLKKELERAHNDTVRLVLNNALALNYADINLDSSLFYIEQIPPLAQKLNDKLDEAQALDHMGFIMLQLHHERTLETLFKAAKIAEDPETENNVLPEKYIIELPFWNYCLSQLAKNGWSPHLLRTELMGPCTKI